MRVALEAIAIGDGSSAALARDALRSPAATVPAGDRQFLRNLTWALNVNSRENGSDTPDFILGEFLRDVLAAWDRAVVKRERWYSREIGMMGPRTTGAPVDPPADAT